MIRKLASKILARLGGAAPAAPAARPPAAPAGVAAPAENLARIEAGAQEVKERIDAGEPVVLLDVRSPGETAGGVIPGAILIPLDELEARWVELKDKNEIVCYCAMGGRSLRAATLLRSRGLFNATSLEGGVGAWRQLGGALQPPRKA